MHMFTHQSNIKKYKHQQYPYNFHSLKQDYFTFCPLDVAAVH